MQANEFYPVGAKLGDFSMEFSGSQLSCMSTTKKPLAGRLDSHAVLFS